MARLQMLLFFLATPCLHAFATPPSTSCLDASVAGACSSADTFMCAGIAKCCPGCGFNNTEAASCTHGVCQCLNCVGGCKVGTTCTAAGACCKAGTCCAACSCPPGSAPTAGKGACDCEQCPIGSYSPGGSEPCKDSGCTAGSSTAAGATNNTCALCPAGQFSQNIGSKPCTDGSTGKCGAAPSAALPWEWCGEKPSCCPGCGANHTDRAQCSTGQCKCINCENVTGACQPTQCATMYPGRYSPPGGTHSASDDGGKYCIDCPAGYYAPGGDWQKDMSVNAPASRLGTAGTKDACYAMCLKAKAKFCAFQCNGCYASPTSLKPVTPASFQQCFQYGLVMGPSLTRTLGTTLGPYSSDDKPPCVACPAGQFSTPGSTACSTPCTDVTSGKCGSAPTFECANVTKCCPGCGLNNTDVAKCDHGECECLNCGH
jgi:hypothetical protein